ncbi:peroxisomal membrane anchor protein conserved region-domain-containing protein [Chlamydoabsidia padenii]|nr:peroxisomal membrane anchor protein conserved region-domain-containing protein [Chlamydoabsidia padenii]
MADDQNNQVDNQTRQKQDIQKLLAGQTISPSPASTNPDTTSLREDKLKLAVSFLSSPKVQTADKSKKTAFLKQKGLTDAEIDEAYRRTTTIASTHTDTQASASQTTTLPTPSSSTLPPVVPTRAPPTRPTHIIYYSEPQPKRLTGKQVLALALLFGVGAVGLASGLVGIVKGFISPILNSIAGYQRNRYNDRHEKLLKLNKSLQHHLPKKSSTEGYWSPLINEQQTLMERLERLVQCSQNYTLHQPYGKFKNTLLDLKQVLERPEYNYSTYTPYSMYGSTNRTEDTAVQGVKSEIRSFKGMLLSRRNFPTAQVKPASTTISTTVAPVPVTPTYHPRQRQSSYRSELQAKEQTGTESTISVPGTTEAQDQDTKDKSTSIEDISETSDK